jgi:hypothetical protein
MLKPRSLENEVPESFHCQNFPGAKSSRDAPSWCLMMRLTLGMIVLFSHNESLIFCSPLICAFYLAPPWLQVQPVPVQLLANWPDLTRTFTCKLERSLPLPETDLYIYFLWQTHRLQSIKGVHWISGPIIRPFFISGIRPDIGFDRPDIGRIPDTKKKSRISGLLEELFIVPVPVIWKFSQKKNCYKC